MNTASSEAIIFFDHEHNVIKEMLYPEFEALLDKVVGIKEFTGSSINAAYIRINNELKITAVVLFKIGFDEKGYLDSRWNIPLRHLSDNAGHGPDLGAGPVKLACHSQCSVSWHQRSLWDPVLQEDSGDNQGTLDRLVSAVANNRLGLVFSNNAIDAEKLSAMTLDMDQLLKSNKKDKPVNHQGAHFSDKDNDVYVSKLKEEYRLRLSTMKSEAAKHIKQLQHNYTEQIKSISSSLKSTKQLFGDEKRKNLQLKNQLDQQAEQFANFRKEIVHENAENTNQNIEIELQAKLEASTIELKEMLSMRDVELFYRDEQIRRLNDEIGELRQEKQKLLTTGSDGLIQEMSDKGINFIACPVGLEQTPIAINEIADYLEKPESYVARKNHIEPTLYLQWLSHIQNPICTHVDQDGKPCDFAVDTIDDPSLFILGESDCCVYHRQSSAVSHVIAETCDDI